MEEEHILLQQEKVFRWEGDKRKQTLFSAKLGRLILTDRRLLFLSTGKNDVNAARLIGGAISPLAGLRTGSTKDLDLSAVTAAGGLDIPLSGVESAELKGMFKVLTIHYRDADGQTRASTFAPKNGGMPDGGTWVSQLEQHRGSSA
ncbi:MAG: hypothetical protein ABIR32_00695 [Ilumatobacteraceae bacterium]